MFDGGLTEMLVVASLFVAGVAAITFIVSFAVDLCRYFAPKDTEAVLFARQQMGYHDYLFEHGHKI